MIKVNQTGLRLLIIAIFITLVITKPINIHAESKSSNYQIEETAIGTSDSSSSSSSSYQSTSAAGALSIGDASSNGYNISNGTKTTADPYLSFNFINAQATFDNFSSSTATTSTTSFSISNYTSYGYTVQIIGEAPSNGSHVIKAMDTNDISKPGTEQFGINLTSNTSPSVFGSNIDNGLYGHGVIADNYKTPNSFRFVNGESIASAPKSSGITIYTISYLINVSSITPGGQYSSNQTIVVTGTY